MRITCAACSTDFEARSSRARFCSAKCRYDAHYRRTRLGLPEGPATPEPAKGKAKPMRTAKAKPEAVPTGALGAVLDELQAAGRLQSSAGQAAVALARRIDDGAESSAGLAALTREMRAAMAEALSRAEATGDALDELRARREARRVS